MDAAGYQSSPLYFTSCFTCLPWKTAIDLLNCVEHDWTLLYGLDKKNHWSLLHDSILSDISPTNSVRTLYGNFFIHY